MTWSSLILICFIISIDVDKSVDNLKKWQMENLEISDGGGKSSLKSAKNVFTGGEFLYLIHKGLSNKNYGDSFIYSLFAIGNYSV